MLSFQRLWAVCDLASDIFMAKELPLEIGKYPQNVKLPSMYFTPPEDSEFVNNKLYLPPELAGHLQQKRPLKSAHPFTSKKVKLSNGKNKFF